MIEVYDLKSYFPQFIPAITASLIFLCSGMEFGWPSPSINILMSNDSHIATTHEDAFWLESFYIIGGLSGVPISLAILHICGRKKSILLCSFSSFVAWIVVATSTTLTQLNIGRLITGLGAATSCAAAPMYISEITEPKMRGCLTALVFIMNMLGILVIYSIVPFMPIYASASIGAGAACLQFVLFSFQPESPYYLLSKSRDEDARRMLIKLRCPTRNIEEEMEQLAKAVARQKAEKGKCLDVIKVASARKAMIIAGFLNISLNFLGIAVVSMNVHVILQNSDAIISNNKSAIMFGIIMLASAIVGSFLIDKYGRRILFITSALLTSISHAILGVYFMLRDVLNIDISGYEWIPFIGVVSYAVFFKFGAGLVPIVVPAEVLPISIKSMAMVFCNMCLAVSGVLSIKIYFATVELYGLYFPFLLFCLWGILRALFVYFYVPETKGKSLEEIQMILKGRKLSETKIEACKLVVLKEQVLNAG